VLLLSIDDLLSRQPLPVYSACYKERVQTDKDRLKLMAAKDFVTTEIEPLFDAAECLMLGKDLFVQLLIRDILGGQTAQFTLD
jgi:hypothetical protein